MSQIDWFMLFQMNMSLSFLAGIITLIALEIKCDCVFMSPNWDGCHPLIPQPEIIIFQRIIKPDIAPFIDRVLLLDRIAFMVKAVDSQKNSDEWSVFVDCLK